MEDFHSLSIWRYLTCYSGGGNKEGEKMAEIKWIKISTGMFDDEAIQVILSMPEGSTLLEIWLRLLITAGKLNDNGLVYIKKDIPYTEDMLATVYKKETGMIKYALSTFSKFGLIEVLNNNQILISNWEKHQNIDGMERVKELTRKRVQRHREKQKTLLLEDTQACNVTCNATVTDSNAIDIDKELDIDIDKDINHVVIGQQPQQHDEKPKKNKKFVKPTVAEIKEYCIERKNSINAEHFFDYYESKGWQVGKNPMKDWKAAVRNWERQEFNKGGVKNESNSRSNDSSRYDRSVGWF